MEPLLTLMHMGALHAYEKWLTFALAFGPFVLLAVVYRIRRRQDAAEADQPGASEPSPGDRGPSGTGSGEPLPADPLLDAEGGLEEVGDHRLEPAAEERHAHPDRE